MPHGLQEDWCSDTMPHNHKGKFLFQNVEDLDRKTSRATLSPTMLTEPMNMAKNQIEYLL